MKKSGTSIRNPIYPIQFAGVLVVGILAGTSAFGDAITSYDIVPIPQHLSGSGNGTLDLRLFTYSGSEIGNTSGAFNGDNGNNTLPQGGGADISSFTESYVTTAGKLKAFYNLNFLPGTINELVFCLDLNETGGGIPVNTLARLDVVLNPATIQGNPNPVLSDVSSSAQAAINQVYSGGTTIAYLNPQPAANLPVNSEGAGFADYAFFTGINPFSLNDNDVLVFNISMGALNNGAEEIFLSGSYAPGDYYMVPEPSALGLMVAGGLALGLRRRTRR